MLLEEKCRQDIGGGLDWHLVCRKNNMAVATRGAGTAYLSEYIGSTPISSGVCVICNVL